MPVTSAHVMGWSVHLLPAWSFTEFAENTARTFLRSIEATLTTASANYHVILVDKMVSLWPWKGEDNSPASFEKALSSLSTKITQTTNRLDSHRQQARRFKALWTLYTTFAYLLYSIILALVLGWQNWGIVEYAAVLGGPVVIYAVRAVASKFFEYRISKTQNQLDELHKQRDETIEKLKIATKYNSTQQLLEKYGGESQKTTPSKSGGDSKGKETESKAGTPQMAGRTGIAPPPTANIRRPPNESTPVHSPPAAKPSRSLTAISSKTDSRDLRRPLMNLALHRMLSPQLRSITRVPAGMTGSWMSCLARTRRSRGTAPPGMKSLEELGRWRCGGCGAWNGVESETNKVLADIKSQSQSADGTWESVSKKDEDVSSNGEVTDDGVIVGSEAKDSEGEEEPEPEQSPRRSKRGRPKGGKKKS
ncbi:hypothetical protein T310_3637 [Rasamsonia emersonii CBS 393.64]|uniref:Endoplasmic reticulum junction formation protein lunapark n=1 Tax=Rasamsonia emersonii (strain ATCC 16479 / CBS 393.64 / IMI 116815) TaxID=1408163 RepID=A0A0F4YVI6_RASE3|nr:hypothetical protein T310_3637 [Rasamsonia emersonii CBS 393.64]KKA22307.1 hypothetical protein T310_3637 [Rasamsonia emersonii CBS 393.64]